MALKKSELYSSLWSGCDELRGGMDASQYKDYVKVERFYVQRMKTKWGNCNPRTRAVRLNADLAKKPREFLEYIIVHEMVHLLEPTHNARFIALMDRFMPKWESFRQALNRLPVRHESWGY